MATVFDELKIAEQTSHLIPHGEIANYHVMRALVEILGEINWRLVDIEVALASIEVAIKETNVDK